MKIEGRNAVSEAILGGVQIDRLVVARGIKDAAGNRVIEAAKERGITIRFMDREALDRESPERRHQGFIAEISDYAYAAAEEIMQAAKKGGALFLLLDGVEDPHNLGSIIRVAECAGVSGIFLPKNRSVSVNETVIRVSAGAAAHVKIARVTNINAQIELLKKQNVFVFAAEAGGASIYKTDLTGNIAVVIGGEGTGVKRLTKELCDGVISLPMMGKVNSLNASVACGAVLYEALRQRSGGK